jgi:hypothetical protein
VWGKDGVGSNPLATAAARAIFRVGCRHLKYRISCLKMVVISLCGWRV